MSDLRQTLDQLDALLAPTLPIPPALSGEPARDDERTSLVIDGLWSTDDYPEYSQQDVLRAYRLGAEDQRALHYARLSAMPHLTAAVRAVLDLADEMRRDRGRDEARPALDGARKSLAVDHSAGVSWDAINGATS